MITNLILLLLVSFSFQKVTAQSLGCNNVLVVLVHKSHIEFKEMLLNLNKDVDVVASSAVE